MRDKHRNLFDVLRLTAAFLVFYAHLYPLFGLPGSDRIVRAFGFVSGGSLGVGIFFAISGYLVTQSIGRSPSLVAFFARRGLRIFPALAITLLLTAFVLGPLLTSKSLSDYFADPQILDYVRSNLLLDPRLALPGLFEGNVYRGTVNGSLWTLQSEVALYLFLPLVTRATTTRTPLIVLCALGCGVLYFWCSRYDRAFSVGLFGPMTEVSRNAAIFFVGAALATIKDWRMTPSVIVATAIAFFLTSKTSYGDLSFLFFLPLLVIGIGNTRTRFAFPLGADISYGFYLYAFPIQQATYQLLSGRIEFRAMAAVALAATSACAIASWFLVEAPVLRMKRKKWAVAAGARLEPVDTPGTL